ncbi:MAG: hypothetical protein ACK5W9_12770 [Bdellovibrionales bacterium]
MNVVGKLPGKTACAAAEYGDILRPHLYATDSAIGSSNAGFINLMENQYKDSKCFRVALKKFYAEVDQIDAETPQRSQFLTPKGLAPRFMSSVSDLKSEKAKPGFLLEKAKRVAGGDPRLALQLIAFCGHDDVNQTGEDDRVHATCPEKDSAMYFSGALYDSGKTQSPIAGRQALGKSRGIGDQTPAKNYHVMMGAFIGCRLAETCGMTAVEISQIEKKFSLAYRMSRMKLSAIAAKEQYKTIIDQYISEVSSGRIKQGQFQHLKEQILRQLESERKPGKEKSDLPGRAEKEAMKILTLLVVDHSTFDQSLKLLGEVNLKNNHSTEEKKFEAFDFLGSKETKNIDFCKQISPDKCDDVLKEVQSWNADLIWTANQHSQGAKLGAEECKKSKELRAGGRASVCAGYEKEPDVTAADRVIRGEKTIGLSSPPKTGDTKSSTNSK